MATHSSTLAWKIPWIEEPGRLQSLGSQSWTRLSDFTFSFSLLSTGFSESSVVKNLSASTEDIRDSGSTPELGRSPGGRHANPV